MAIVKMILVFYGIIFLVNLFANADNVMPIGSEDLKKVDSQLSNEIELEKQLQKVDLPGITKKEVKKYENKKDNYSKILLIEAQKQNESKGSPEIKIPTVNKPSLSTPKKKKKK